jgi:diguanylate cyclase (GGDEF)-like protein
MDIQSLGIGISVCLILQYAVLLGTVSRALDEPAYSAFRWGAVCGGLGLMLNMSQGVAHPAIPFVVGNTLIALCPSWFWIGLRRLKGEQPSLRVLAAIALLMAAAGWAFGVASDHIGPRLTTNALLIALGTAGASWTLFSLRRHERIFRWLGLLTLLLTLLLLARVLIHWWLGIPRQHIFEPHPLNAVVYLGALLGFAVYAMGLNVLVARRVVQKVRGLAGIDALTGALNRRGLREAVEGWLREPHAVAALILADLDHFKAINDSHGHEAGDALLQRFADIARLRMGPGDVLARMGGEEFLLLARGQNPLALAERLRRDFAEPLPGLPPVTASFGLVIDCRPDPAAFRDGLRRADEALYRAKEGGRNRVEVARPQTLRPERPPRPP